jgi:hypothetical protein
MSKKSKQEKYEFLCGSCEFYSEYAGYKNGECRYVTLSILPWCLEDVDFLVAREDGQGCRCWEPKTRSNEVQNAD